MGVAAMSVASDFDRMILEFMQDDPLTAVFHQITSTGAYNPATSEPVTTQVDTNVQGILLDLDRNSQGLMAAVGKEILVGDKMFYMRPVEKTNPSATPIVPNPTSDKITVANITYQIALVRSADPTGAAPVLYEMILRR